MHATEETQYRLRLAEGFLEEARQDLQLQRWRSCVDNCQLAVENSAKAVLGIIGPIGRTHNPAVLLRTALEDGRFSPAIRNQVERIAECAKALGPDVHIESDYGDEANWLTPWELFEESDAQQTLSMAEEALTLAKQTVRGD